MRSGYAIAAAVVVWLWSHLVPAESPDEMEAALGLDVAALS